MIFSHYLKSYGMFQRIFLIILLYFLNLLSENASAKHLTYTFKTAGKIK